MVVDIRGRRDGGEISLLLGVCVGVCVRVVLACASHARPCLCCDEVRTGQMGYIGDGNGPNPCCETRSGTGERWGMRWRRG